MKDKFIFFKILFFLSAFAYVFTCKAQNSSAQNPIQVGAEQFEKYANELKNKRVGLVVNQTSRVGDQHLVDFLLSQKIKIQKIFAPEHGFRGDADAGEKITSGKDAKTGIEVVSLYGKLYKPTAEQIQDLDVLVFDIQDVGVRFYTFISTMHYVMEACAEQGKTFLILDRPNPNGSYVDGNIREEAHKSFVSLHPIPIVHGLTVGELAKMILGEKWLANPKNHTKFELKIVPCNNYSHKSSYSLPVRPSPNLPNDRSIELYATICLFEGTTVSVGRGTDFPFQVAGSPEFADSSFYFVPKPNFGSKQPPYENQKCYGKDYRQSTDWKYRFSLAPLIEFYQKTGRKSTFFKDYFKRLCGTDKVREMIEQGKSEEEIRKTWEKEIFEYKKKRKKYLLYEDFE